MKRKYQGYSTNFMEYRSQNFNQLRIIRNGITTEITMHAVLRIDRLFQQNNNNGTRSGENHTDRMFQQNNKDGTRSGVKHRQDVPTENKDRMIKTEPGPAYSTDRMFQRNNKDRIIEECHQV